LSRRGVVASTTVTLATPASGLGGEVRLDL
jgi:hypothetical protein